MGNINPQYNDRVRYTLKNRNFESLIVTEPIGWNDDEKEYARHENYHGVFAKFSNSLKFIDSGAEYIQLVLDVYGINEEIELIRDEKHPQTDVWTLSYSGFLDLSTWTRENNQVSVKFNSGGLEQLLKSRESEKIEIDRNTTIDGKTIPELETIYVEHEGRRIFLKTTYEIKPTENTVVMYNQTNGQTRGSDYPIPLALKNKSHEEAQSPIVGTRIGDDEWDRSASGETGSMFFAVSDFDRTLRIRFNLRFRVRITSFDDINFFRFWLSLITYKNSSNYNYKQKNILYTTDNYYAINNDNFSISFDQTINLLAGESLGLIVSQNMDGSNGHSAHLDISVENIESDYFEITEDSFFEKTNAKAVLAHEMGERLVTIGTNTEQSFYSDFLGRTDIGYLIDGKAALTAFSHGFWIRGFDKLPIPTEGPPKVENLYKPLTTSFKEFVESMSAVWNIGIGIEKVGFRERVRLEELSYFYNLNVTIRLPNQVKNVKRTIAADKYYSSFEGGFKEGGDYEEACGLDEYNVKSTFTTFINRLKNSYVKLSNYRGDSYGIEFARRKQKSFNNTEDTSYDDKIFFLDLKRFLPSLFKQRKWQDDFQSAPTGIFSPETATNLRFSPFNCLLRHSWWFSGGLKKYLTEYVRYGSSVSNSQLKTKLRTDSTYVNNLSNTPGNGNEYAENGNIINSELQTSRFIPEEIEFEHVCDFDVMQQVNGTTTILGKKIPNFYGLVEFINEKNEIEKGFLFNLKPNGKGAWKLLKANR